MLSSASILAACDSTTQALPTGGGYSDFSFQGNPLCSLCALSVVVIESLKIVSYVHVNYWCRCARLERLEESKKDDITRPDVGMLMLVAAFSRYPSVNSGNDFINGN